MTPNSPLPTSTDYSSCNIFIWAQFNENAADSSSEIVNTTTTTAQSPQFDSSAKSNNSSTKSNATSNLVASPKFLQLSKTIHHSSSLQHNARKSISTTSRRIMGHLLGSVVNRKRRKRSASFNQNQSTSPHQETQVSQTSAQNQNHAQYNSKIRRRSSSFNSTPSPTTEPSNSEAAPPQASTGPFLSMTINNHSSTLNIAELSTIAFSFLEKSNTRKSQQFSSVEISKIPHNLLPICPPVIDLWIKNGLHLGENIISIHCSPSHGSDSTVVQRITCYYFKQNWLAESSLKYPQNGSTQNAQNSLASIYPEEPQPSSSSSLENQKVTLPATPTSRAEKYVPSSLSPRFILFDLQILSNTKKDILLLWKNKNKLLIQFRHLLQRLKYVQGYHIVYISKNRYSSEEELHNILFQRAKLPLGFVISVHQNLFEQFAEKSSDFISSVAKTFRYDQIGDALSSLSFWKGHSSTSHGTSPQSDKSPSSAAKDMSNYTLSAVNTAFALNRFFIDLRISSTSISAFVKVALFREFNLRALFCKYMFLDPAADRVFVVRKRGIFAGSNTTLLASDNSPSFSPSESKSVQETTSSEERREDSNSKLQPLFSSISDLMTPQVLSQITPMRALYDNLLPFNCVSLVMEFLPFSSKIDASSTCHVWRTVFLTVFLSPAMKSFCQKTSLRVSMLANYIGLQPFLEENFLYKRVLYYKHPLVADDSVVIMLQGEALSWRQFYENHLVFESKATAEDYSTRVVVNNQYLLINATYSWRGIEIFPDYDSINIDELTLDESSDLEEAVKSGKIIAFNKEDPSQWGNCNIIRPKVDCSLSTGPRIIGDHAFFQLCSSEGYIFSFGLYAKDWSQIGNKMQTGKVWTPDPNEYFTKPNGVIISGDFKIPRHVWSAFLRENLRYIRDEKFIFHVSKSNCTDYVLRYLHRVGLDLPTEYLLMNHGTHGGYNFLRLFPQTANVEYLFRLPSNVLVSAATSAMTRELRERLKDPEQRKMLTKANPTLFVTKNGSLDLRATYTYLREHVVKATEFNSPYMFGKSLLDLRKRRTKRGDSLYVPKRYKGRKYDHILREMDAQDEEHIKIEEVQIEEDPVNETEVERE